MSTPSSSTATMIDGVPCVIAHASLILTSSFFSAPPVPLLWRCHSSVRIGRDCLAAELRHEVGCGDHDFVGEGELVGDLDERFRLVLARRVIHDHLAADERIVAANHEAVLVEQLLARGLRGSLREAHDQLAVDDLNESRGRLAETARRRTVNRRWRCRHTRPQPQLEMCVRGTVDESRQPRRRQLRVRDRDRDRPRHLVAHDRRRQLDQFDLDLTGVEEVHDASPSKLDGRWRRVSRGAVRDRRRPAAQAQSSETSCSPCACSRHTRTLRCDASCRACRWA